MSLQKRDENKLILLYNLNISLISNTVLVQNNVEICVYDSYDLA